MNTATQIQPQTTMTVNEAVVKFDNMINACSFLLEELETRKKRILNLEDIVDELRVKIDTEEYQQKITQLLMSSFGEGAVKEVAFYVMSQIDSTIESFINARVDAAISSRLNN